jgi:hypothetical protein
VSELKHKIIAEVSISLNALIETNPQVAEEIKENT